MFEVLGTTLALGPSVEVEGEDGDEDEDGARKARKGERLGRVQSITDPRDRSRHGPHASTQRPPWNPGGMLRARLRRRRLARGDRKAIVREVP